MNIFCISLFERRHVIAHLPCESFNCGFATLLLDEFTLEVHLIRDDHKVGCFSIKWSVLSLNPLPLWLAQVNGRRPILHHLRVCAHGCALFGTEMPKGCQIYLQFMALFMFQWIFIFFYKQPFATSIANIMSHLCLSRISGTDLLCCRLRLLWQESEGSLNRGEKRRCYCIVFTDMYYCLGQQRFFFQSPLFFSPVNVVDGCLEKCTWVWRIWFFLPVFQNYFNV